MTEKKMGRPPRSKQGASTRAISMRVPPQLFDEIQEEARASGRSISAQAERRLIYPETDITRLVDATVAAAKTRVTNEGGDAKAIRLACRRAAHIAVEVAFGELAGPTDDEVEALVAGGKIDEANKLMNEGFAAADLAEFLVGKGVPE